MVAISTTTDSSSGVRAGGRPGWARVRSDASPSSPKYGLLRVLSLNAGRVCTYEDLIRRVWGNKSGNPKLVRAFVKKLRRKPPPHLRPRPLLGGAAVPPGHPLTCTAAASWAPSSRARAPCGASTA